MSAQPIDNDVALPHAGLLAYFRPSTLSPQTQTHDVASPPPPYCCDTSGVAYSPITTLYKTDDEESQYGFWGERYSSEDQCDGTRLRLVKRDHQGFYSFCCFWCAVLVCMIGGMGIIFTTNLTLSSLGFGTGVARWMVDASAGTGAQSYDMHFCLASTNREAPGPQIWRHITSNDVARCKTDVLTLSAGSTEHWKLRIDDQSLFGDDIPHEAASDKGNKFINADTKTQSKDTEGGSGRAGVAEIWDLY